MYVGALNDFEFAAFTRAVKAGRATRTYEGLSGVLGLAKVKIVVGRPSEDSQT